MNNLSLIITDEAYSDIERIADYIAQDNKIAAQKLTSLLHKTCQLLTEFPSLGNKKSNIKAKDVQIFIVKKKYLIAYKIDKDKLIVLKITNKYQDTYSLL